MTKPWQETADYKRLTTDEGDDDYTYASFIGPPEPLPMPLAGATVLREFGVWLAQRYQKLPEGEGHELRVYRLVNPDDKYSGWRWWFTVRGDTTPQVHARARKSWRRRMIEGRYPAVLTQGSAELARLRDWWLEKGEHLLLIDTESMAANMHDQRPRHWT